MADRKRPHDNDPDRRPQRRTGPRHTDAGQGRPHGDGGPPSERRGFGFGGGRPSDRPNTGPRRPRPQSEGYDRPRPQGEGGDRPRPDDRPYEGPRRPRPQGQGFDRPRPHDRPYDGPRPQRPQGEDFDRPRSHDRPYDGPRGPRPQGEGFDRPRPYDRPPERPRPYDRPARPRPTGQGFGRPRPYARPFDRQASPGGHSHRPFERQERPHPEGEGFDRPRPFDRNVDRPGGAFDSEGPNRPFDRPNRPFDTRSFDRPNRAFDRPRRPYVERAGGPEGAPERRYDRPERHEREDRVPPRHAPVDIESFIGEDEEIVAGRHPVEEAFLARRSARRLLVVPQRRQALEKVVLHAANLRIPIVEVEGGTLTALTGFDGHQGIALVTDKRQFASLDDIVSRAKERNEPPFVLVLDSLEDPQNLGTLLRTAESAGVHGVVFPTRRQAPLSAAAIKASAGAVEHLLLAPVEDLAGALADLHIRGLRVLGSEADAPMTAREADLRGAVALVVGSEGQGLGPSIRRRCDGLVRIPMRGRIASLNAAVAGSILLYEASSQRGGEAAPRFRPPAIPEFAGSDGTVIPDEEPEPVEAAMAESEGGVETVAAAEHADAVVEPQIEPEVEPADAAVEPAVDAAVEPEIDAAVDAPIGPELEPEEVAAVPSHAAVEDVEAAAAPADAPAIEPEDEPLLPGGPRVELDARLEPSEHAE